jgi:hypothetical protein
MRLGPFVPSLLVFLFTLSAPSQATQLPLTQILTGPDWELTVITYEIPTDPINLATTLVEWDLLWHGALDSYPFADTFALYSYDPPLPADWTGWQVDVRNVYSTLLVEFESSVARVTFGFVSPEPQQTPEPAAGLVFGAGLLALSRARTLCRRQRRGAPLLTRAG